MHSSRYHWEPGNQGDRFRMQLLEENRISVSPHTISVKGKSYPLTANTTIEAVQTEPSLMAAFFALAAGTLGIPAAIIINRVTPDDYSWLVGFPVACMLGAIFHVLTAEPTYVVVVASNTRMKTIVTSRDHQLVISLVAALRDARRNLATAHEGTS